jgi:ankyrin repeat protein
VLLQAYPEAVQVQDHWGKKLVEVMDHNGMLPLHHACYNGLPIDMLQVLVDANPEACMVKDSIGRQPWQLLRISGAAARRDEEGMYPLHIACRKKASLNLLKLLLDAFPECILRMDDYGKTPTQLLADSGVAAQRDMNEMLLLHHVCSDFCNDDPCYNLKPFLKLILDAYPNGKNVLDKDNMSPLHHACARANSEEALHLLVTSLVTNDCEPSINAKDRFGRTPLCILMRRTDPAQVNLNSKSLAEIVEVIVSSKVIEYLVHMGANIHLGDAEKNQVSKMFLCIVLSIFGVHN